MYKTLLFILINIITLSEVEYTKKPINIDPSGTLNDMREEEKVLIELINKQLEPHNVTYDDVIGVDNWFQKYTTTKDKEKEFIEWGVQHIKKRLLYTEKYARKQMDLFILNHGLKTL